MSYPRFWSDDFDMDLPKILPGFDDILGDAADVTLWTHGGESHGRLNHPSVWGINACFGLSPTDTGKPDGWHTDQPLIECTWREAVRDAWPHTYRLNVNGWLVWDTHREWSLFNKLMAGVRGECVLPSGERNRLLGRLGSSVEWATKRFQKQIAAGGAR